MFASPLWLLAAAPALLLPILAMILFDHESGPSAIEQAIATLPLPGDATGDGTAPNLFGANARQVPPNIGAQLYANSARAAAAANRPERRDDGPHLRDIALDPAAEAYAALHPRHLAGEDLLVGDLALLTQSMAPDLSGQILAEFCTARPDDPGYMTKLTDLPLSQDILISLTAFAPGANIAAFCKRFS